MKNMLKQLVKAICYVILFAGTQAIVSFIATFCYGIKLGVQVATGGTVPDQTVITEEITKFLNDYLILFVLISGVITVFILWMFFKVRKKKLLQEVSFRKFGKEHIIPIVILGTALSFCVTFLLQILPIPKTLMEDYMQSSEQLLEGKLLVILVADILVAPIVEEIIFRGLVLSRLRKAMPLPVAILLSSLAFALMHGQIIWMMYTFLLGIVLCIVAVYTESIGASLLLHMTFNTIGVLVGALNLTDIAAVILIILSVAIATIMLWLIIVKKKEQVSDSIKESGTV